MEIEAVNRQMEVALTSDGEYLHITTWIDGDGDITDVPSEAAACVARYDDDNWLAIDLGCFERPIHH